MSYEVVIGYYSPKKDGIDGIGFDDSTPKEKVHKFGKRWDDIVEIQQVANFIYSQLARRDIYVFRFEVFEFVKKKIPAKMHGLTLHIGGKQYYSPEFGKNGSPGTEESFREDETSEQRSQTEVRHRTDIRRTEDTASEDARLDALLNGKAIVEDGNMMPFPLGMPDEISCDSAALPRTVMYSPIPGGNRPTRSDLEIGGVYQIVGRVRPKNSESEESVVFIVKTPSGLCVRERGIDFSSAPKPGTDYSQIQIVGSKPHQGNSAQDPGEAGLFDMPDLRAMR